MALGICKDLESMESTLNMYPLATCRLDRDSLHRLILMCRGCCADLLPSVDVDLTALYKALYLKLNITLDVPDLPTVNLRVLLKGFNFNIGDLMPRFGFSVPHIILAGMSPVPSLGSFLPSLNVNISNILDGVNIDLPSIPAVTIRLNTLLAGLTPPPSFPDLFGPITIDLSALLKNIPDLPPLPPLPPIKISLPDFLGLIPGITPPLSLSGLLPRIVVRLPALPSVSLDLWSTLKKWSISITELLQVNGCSVSCAATVSLFLDMCAVA